MTYRTMFFQIIISIMCCICPVTTAMYNQGGMPQMQNFEAELEEANRAIEEYVASLPPAEQAEFNRQVEDMSKMFENMSEEEFEKFLGEMFTEEQMMEPNPFETSEPTVQEVVEVTLSADDKKKVETAIKVLDDVINQSNLFMVIINSSPDLPNRINRWAAKGVLSNWQEGLDWDKLKIELENFVQKLYKALEQDLTTKKYKYLFELIADEALYNNIIQLQSSLNALVPTINLPEFSIQKLSAQSKTAIKNILNKYTESFYLLTIPKSLDALFEKYAPEAEKIRAAEEAATKKALDASKGIRTPAAAAQAGMEAEGGYDYNPYGGYDSYYGGGGYDPYYGGDGYKPNYGGGYEDYGSGGGGSSRGGGRGGESAGGGSRASGEEKSKEEKEREEKKKREERQFIPHLEIERAIADIKSGLEDIAAEMVTDETTGVLKSLAMLDEIIKKPEVDVILAGSTLPMVDKKLSVIDEAIKKISSKTFNAKDLTHYQDEVKKAFAKNDKELKALLDQIDNFERKTEDEKEAAKKAAPKTATEETTSTKVEVSDLPVAQQWAYFGTDASTLSSDAANVKLQEQITAPVSLFDIKKKLVELRKDIDTFQKKKAPAEKKKSEPVVESPSTDE